VTSQLSIQTTKILYRFLTCTCAPHLGKGSATNVRSATYCSYFIFSKWGLGKILLVSRMDAANYLSLLFYGVPQT